MTKDSRWLRLLVRSTLRAAGVPAARVDRAARLVDLDRIDVDEDGEATGLDEQLAELREDWPELFTAPAEDDQQHDEDQDGAGRDEQDAGAVDDESDLPGHLRQAVTVLRSVGDQDGAARLIAEHRRPPDPRSSTERLVAKLLRQDDPPDEAA